MGTRFNKIKAHVIDHKEIYIAITVTAIFTSGLTMLIMQRAQISSAVTQKALIAWKPVMEQNTNIIIQAPGNSGNVLMDDLGNLYSSQNSAAKALGVSPTSIVDHLSGRKDFINGRKLTKVLDGSPKHVLAA